MDSNTSKILVNLNLHSWTYFNGTANKSCEAHKKSL